MCQNKVSWDFTIQFTNTLHFSIDSVIENQQGISHFFVKANNILNTPYMTEGNASYN